MSAPATSVAVVRQAGSHRLEGSWADVDTPNAFLLAHLECRGFSPATVRAYAFDLLNFSRFLSERGLSLGDVVPTNLFGYLDWQAKPKLNRGQKVVRLAEGRGAAPATMNRRIAAVRGLFEYSVIAGVRADNPVPAPRRGQGLRPKAPGAAGTSVTDSAPWWGPGRSRAAPSP